MELPIIIVIYSTPSSKELLVANSDVPFQSVTNNLLHSQFAMQMYALHQVDVIHPNCHTLVVCACVTLDLYALASSLVDKNKALGLWPHLLYYFINSTGSSCGQIQCHMQSYTLTITCNIIIMQSIFECLVLTNADKSA